MAHAEFRKVRVLVAVACAVLCGCQALQDIDRAAGETAQALAPPDAVTGARTLQLYPAEHDIEQGTLATEDILKQFREAGVSVDPDTDQFRRLKRVFEDITKVTHLPDLPWEVHLIDHQMVNACAAPGGKVLVFRGLFGGMIDAKSNDELAAVLAHEAAHVTCRHTSERESWQAIAIVSKNLRKRFHNDPMFKASYTTKIEEEADRIGILYMALAGYDPAVVPGIWAREHRRSGSDPSQYNYLYDHPLNAHRTRQVAAAARKARKYYKGPRQRNPNYKELLANNDLVDKRSLGSNSGLLQLLEAFANSALQYKTARLEEKQRKRQQQIDANARRYLVVHNRTGRTLRVYVNLYTRGPYGFQWRNWGDQGLNWAISPGQRTRLSMPGGYVLEGSTAVIWADGEQGRLRWSRRLVNLGGMGDQVKGEIVVPFD